MTVPLSVQQSKSKHVRTYCNGFKGGLQYSPIAMEPGPGYNRKNRKAGQTMLAYTYLEKGRFELREKLRPVLLEDRDAIVKVTLASICTSDLHIKHGSVPRAVPGITVGHEMVGVVEEVGPAVRTVHPGDRVTVNVETFCGECFFCKNGWVNNCTDSNGGWALGCRIDGGQAEYVRVPYADQGRILGSPYLEYPPRGYGADPGGRAHRAVHPPVCAALQPPADHRVRPG